MQSSPRSPPRIVEILSREGIDLIETLVNTSDEALAEIHDLSREDISMLKRIIAESIEIIEDESGEAAPSPDEYAGEAGETPETGTDTETTGEVETESEPVGEQPQEAASAGGDDEGEEEEITLISELPDVPEHIVEALRGAGVEVIVDLLTMTRKQLLAIKGLSGAGRRAARSCG